MRWPKLKYDYDIPDAAREIVRIREKPRPSTWAEDNWSLTKVYARPGRFIPHAWQRPIIDLIADYLKIYIVAPVRMGKTMISEIMRGYCIDIYHMGGMVIYPTHDLGKSNFKIRTLPSFSDIPAMAKHLTGRADDLTIEQIILKYSIWNIASAQNRNEIAQYPAQFVQGDEVAKWRITHFDPVALINGRQMDYVGTRDYRQVLSSSPWEVGDLFYKTIYKSGTRIITPHAKCPHCSQWFEWSDHDIIENLSGDSKLRKDPTRLKSAKEKSVSYICPCCGREILEESRYEMVENTVWAASKVALREFEQSADTINFDGSVVEANKKCEAIAVNWNRLLDINWKFYECLAAFFTGLRDPKLKRAYESEDMGRFPRNDISRKSVDFIFSKRFGYLQYGTEVFVPDGVYVITCHMDTQDNGFYCVKRGWGRGMETWLLWHDFIETPMNYDAKNKEEVLNVIRPQLEKILRKKNGMTIPIIFGLIDRGGHRPEYVDYLCDHIPWLHSYVGLTQIDYKKPIIRKSDSKDAHPKLYVGQTRLLSDRVEGRIGSSNWHLPDDVTEEYQRQLIAQYYSEEVDEHGQIKREFIRLPQDHYRDCENYGEGCAIVLGLDELLTKDDGIRRIEENIIRRNKPEHQAAEKQAAEKQDTKSRRPIPGRRTPWLAGIRRK